MLHYNRGRALQGLGRNAEALDEFEKFELSASPKLAEAVPQLAEMMTAVRRQVAEVKVNCHVPGATLHVQQKALPLRLARGRNDSVVSPSIAMSRRPGGWRDVRRR